MFRMTTVLTVPSFVLLMSGTAHAALTADQVWQDWKDAAAKVGLTVSSATEAKDGGALTLNGITIAPSGETGGFTISDMVLTEQGDGSVSIVPGANIGIELSGDASGSAKITHDGLKLSAHEGDGDALIYDFSAASLDLVLDAAYPGSAPLDGSAAQPGATKGSVGFTGLTGTYSDTPGANRTFGFDIAATKLNYDIASDDPGAAIKSTSVSETDDVAVSLQLALPAVMSLIEIAGPADFGKALQEGLSLKLTSKQGASKGANTQENPMFPYAMNVVAMPGEATITMNKDALSVQSDGAGLVFDMTSSALPVPVKVSAGPVSVGMTMPIMAADVAADYGLKFKLSQFTVNEEAWAMLDPGGALKRDPADLVIDVSGKVKLDAIVLMEAEAAGMTDVPPPAPETLDITELTLKVAGAAFAGTGAFTFDNTGPVPMPLGEANVTLSGANGVIDGLIASGLVAEEDAMGVRMMMGAFMSPGAEPDSLTSKIEAKAGGEIYVNGQRIQ